VSNLSLTNRKQIDVFPTFPSPTSAIFIRLLIWLVLMCLIGLEKARLVEFCGAHADFVYHSHARVKMMSFRDFCTLVFFSDFLRVFSRF